MHSQSDWVTSLARLQAQGHPCVLVTLLGTRGSTPRDSGTKMLVSSAESYASIGGGRLEYQAIERARQLLANHQSAEQQHIEYFKLSPAVGQCCGGSTSLLFETFSQQRPQLMLFGAGHVGRALVKILAGLPLTIHWVDNREELINGATDSDNIICRQSDNPAIEIQSMPAGSYYLVMTHHHPLDFEIVNAILQKNDFAYLGLIGSKTKWRRFKHHLQQLDIPETDIEKISCPVGLAAVPGKKPMEIAVSIAAELIGHYQSLLPETQTQQGLAWKDIRQLLDQKVVEDE